MTIDMPFKVVVDGKRTAMVWGYYATVAEAAESARRLRALGMHARAVANDDLGQGLDLADGQR